MEHMVYIFPSQRSSLTENLSFDEKNEKDQSDQSLGPVPHDWFHLSAFHSLSTVHGPWTWPTPGGSYIWRNIWKRPSAVLHGVDICLPEGVKLRQAIVKCDHALINEIWKILLRWTHVAQIEESLVCHSKRNSVIALDDQPTVGIASPSQYWGLIEYNQILYWNKEVMWWWRFTGCNGIMMAYR